MGFGRWSKGRGVRTCVLSKKSVHPVDCTKVNEDTLKKESTLIIESSSVLRPSTSAWASLIPNDLGKCFFSSLCFCANLRGSFEKVKEPSQSLAG